MQAQDICSLVQSCDGENPWCGSILPLDLCQTYLSQLSSDTSSVRLLRYIFSVNWMVRKKLQKRQ